jgi:Tfp pilus assembly protein PilN
MSSPSQLSFLPDDYLERKAQRRTNVVCAILFLIVATAIGGAFMLSDKALKEARQRNAEASVKYSEAARPIQQFQQLQEKQRTMAHQAELTSSLLEKVPRSFLLAELTNAMPPGVSLIEMKLDSRRRAAPAPPPKSAFEQKREAAAGIKQASAPPPVRQYDVAVKLIGMASTDVQVAQFISKLNGSPMLKDVNLIISDEYATVDEKLRKFEIELMLNPAAEVEHLNRNNTKTAAAELSK